MSGRAGPTARRLAEQVQVVVAGMLQRRVKDPRLGFVTVTEARLTADLRDATVYYTVLGEPASQAATAAALESAKGLIRAEIGHRLGLRHTPTLTFVADAVPESAVRLEEVLRRARADDVERARRAVGASYAGDPDPYREPRSAEADQADEAGGAVAEADEADEPDEAGGPAGAGGSTEAVG